MIKAGFPCLPLTDTVGWPDMKREVAKILHMKFEVNKAIFTSTMQLSNWVLSLGRNDVSDVNSTSLKHAW